MSKRDIFSAMLKENTGAHMLDSGGAYGRHWEQNQKRNFKKEPAHTLKFSAHDDGRFEIECQHNLYHFLKHGLSYDGKLDREFQAFCRRKENRDEHWMANMEAFAEYKGWKGTLTVNTYNGEDMLSQTIQYLQYDPYVLLQVHNGCDARGGYTKPRVFLQDDEWLYNNARAVLAPEASPEPPQPDMFPDVLGESPIWRTYDAGYSWEPGQSTYRDIGRYECTTDPEKRKAGIVYIDEDGNGYCPLTGRKLILDYY